jgi:hypothetical protein
MFGGVGAFYAVNGRTRFELVPGWGVAGLPGQPSTAQVGPALLVRGSYAVWSHLAVQAQLAGVVYDTDPDPRWPLHAGIAAVGVSVGWL